MNTVNIVLMIILSVMIGFAIGNVYGKEAMKKTFGDLLDNLTKSMQATISKKEEHKKE